MRELILPKGLTVDQRDKWKSDTLREIDRIDWDSLNELECVEFAVERSVQSRSREYLDRSQEDKQVVKDIVYVLRDKLKQVDHAASQLSTDTYRYLKMNICRECLELLRLFDILLT